MSHIDNSFGCLLFAANITARYLLSLNVVISEVIPRNENRKYPNMKYKRCRPIVSYTLMPDIRIAKIKISMLLNVLVTIRN